MSTCQFYDECLKKMAQTIGAGATEEIIVTELEHECYPCGSHGSSPLATRSGCFDCLLDDRPCPEQLVHVVVYDRGCHMKPR